MHSAEIWGDGKPFEKNGKTKTCNDVWVWFQQNKKLLQDINPLDASNHKHILQQLGLESRYNNELNSLKKMGPIPTMMEYYILVWVIQHQKINGLGRMMDVGIPEGNNRMGAAICLLLNSKYDSSAGRISYGTLSKDWFCKSISNNIGDQEASAKLLQGKEELIKLLEPTVTDDNFMFGRQIRCVLLTGKTKQQFKKLNISKEQAQEKLKRVSQGISKSKTGSSIADEATLIAEALTVYNTALKQKSMYTEVGEVPTYAIWTGKDDDGNDVVHDETYVELEEGNKNDVPCTLLKTKEWKAFVRNPTMSTLDTFTSICQAGVITLEGTGKKKKWTYQEGKRMTAPFLLSDESFFDGVGKTVPKATPDTVVSVGKGSKKGKKIKKGKPKNKPVSPDDINRWILFAFVFPSMYRAKHDISPNNWDESTKREKCYDELNLLIELMASNASSLSNSQPAEEILERNNVPENELKFCMPISTGREHWAATLLIADIVVVSSYYRNPGKRTSQVTAVINRFIHFIHHLPKDSRSYYNYDMMEDLGKDDSLVQNNHDDRNIRTHSIGIHALHVHMIYRHFVYEITALYTFGGDCTQK